jgi:c-di-GMP-related signal transduction protein
MSEDIFLGRQPILDAESRLYAFELLFRSSLVNAAYPFDEEMATSSVIVRALSDFGVDAVLEANPGFINCNAAFLMSDTVELLPSDRIVLEILETTAATEELIARCQYLRGKGYRLALDDFTGVNELNRAFLPLADIVKVDIRPLDQAALFNVTRQLAELNLLLLAEKVETEDEFRHCKQLGYQYFQGYYFSRPEVMKGKRLSPGQMALIRVMAILQREDAEIREIEEIFKEHPALGVSLLRLANSASSGLRVQLKSISSAIFALGRRQLERWVLLLMMAEGKSDGKLSLLLHMAATRGKFMELLAPAWSGKPGLSDSAFITGVVSMMDSFLGMPMEQVVDSLGLSDEMRDALLRREGFLGSLLGVAEALEQESGEKAEQEFIRRQAQEVGPMLNHAQGEALAWANKVLKAA